MIKIGKDDMKHGMWVFTALLVIAGAQYFLASFFPRYHDVMKYLYFVPIVIAAYHFGWKWGIAFSAAASLVSSLHLGLHGELRYLDMLLQAAVFSLGGGLLGFIAEDDREKRRIIDMSKVQFLRSLSQALDARDTYTEGHSERVARMARMLGAKAGLSGRKLELLYQAGLMHDIGKIGVPDSVLMKPGTLDADEYRRIKDHSAIGADILSKVEMFKELVPAVRHHHERFDGTGYPDRLAGEAIPRAARIIAVADAYDAMVSQRTYNRRKSPAEAAREIAEGAGSQFDPGLAALLVSLPFPFGARNDEAQKLKKKNRN